MNSTCATNQTETVVAALLVTLFAFGRLAQGHIWGRRMLCQVLVADGYLWMGMGWWCGDTKAFFFCLQLLQLQLLLLEATWRVSRWQEPREPRVIDKCNPNEAT